MDSRTMRKFIPYDKSGAPRVRQPLRREKERERVIDYWVDRGFEPIRFAGEDVDLQALELQGGDAGFVLVTARDVYELPATLQAAVSVSFHAPDGRIARSCDAKSSQEAWVLVEAAAIGQAR
jgi:hypothetical protein